VCGSVVVDSWNRGGNWGKQANSSLNKYLPGDGPKKVGEGSYVNKGVDALSLLWKS